MEDEFDIIRDLEANDRRPAGVRVGIGDDAAVFERDRFDLITTDVVVEDVHYRLDWCSPADVGWRALAASLSDIAAMGGRPGPWVVSIGVGPDHDNEFVDGVIDGLEAAAADLGAEFDTLGGVGGDLSSTRGPSFVSVTLVGESADGGALLRRGASPGDHIVVTGQPGRSAAGLASLWGQLDANAADDQARRNLEAAYRRPHARCTLGARLGETRLPSALIDVSDGLVADLGHILETSQVGARLQFESLPVDDDLRGLGLAADAVRREFVAGGGEDFELAATVSPERLSELEQLARTHGWPVSKIGAIVPPEAGFAILDRGDEPLELTSAGWEHFSSSQASEG